MVFSTKLRPEARALRPAKRLSPSSFRAAPGSIVRVRSVADPDPEVKGYAKKVIEVRQQLAPAR